MNCPYCQQPCRVSTYYHPQILEKNDKQWYCGRHRHPVYLLQFNPADGKNIHIVEYHTVYQQREFTITDYHLLGETGGVAWEIAVGTKIMLLLDYIPQHITPDNIDDKLPLLLPLL